MKGRKNEIRTSRQALASRRVLRGARLDRLQVPSRRGVGGRIRPRRTLRRGVAHGLRLRHELLLSRRVRRLRRAVRLEVRHLLDVGRHRQRGHRLASRVDGPRPAHKAPYAAPRLRHDARLLREALRLVVAQARRVRDHLRLPHPLHRLALQRPLAPLLDGVPGLLLFRVHRRDGRPHRGLRDRGRLSRDGDQRLHTGHNHARRTRRRHLRGALLQGRVRRVA